jgi:hypothetical protein
MNRSGFHGHTAVDPSESARPDFLPGYDRHKPECIEIDGLEDAAKLVVCICIKFESQK